jgi:hypothetical protein
MLNCSSFCQDFFMSVKFFVHGSEIFGCLNMFSFSWNCQISFMAVNFLFMQDKQFLVDYWKSFLYKFTFFTQIFVHVSNIFCSLLTEIMLMLAKFVHHLLKHFLIQISFCCTQPFLKIILFISNKNMLMLTNISFMDIKKFSYKFIFF